jgi:hypothetical protein
MYRIKFLPVQSKILQRLILNKLEWVPRLLFYVYANHIKTRSVITHSSATSSTK